MGEKFEKGMKIVSGTAAVLGAAVTIIRVFSGK